MEGRFEAQLAHALGQPAYVAGNQKQSEAIRSNQKQSPPARPVCIRGRQSEAIRSNQKQSEAQTFSASLHTWPARTLSPSHAVCADAEPARGVRASSSARRARATEPR